MVTDERGRAESVSYAENRLYCEDCESWLTEMELLISIHREIQHIKGQTDKRHH